MMLRIVFISFFLLSNTLVIAQNKMGYTWIVGFNVDYAKFDGINPIPLTGQKFNASHPSTPMMFGNAHSNICDSASGDIILSTGGMRLYDSLGYLVENGDSLQPNSIYLHNSPPNVGNSQGSIILPKGNNKEYYVFIPTVSDSFYNLVWTAPGATKAPFDMLRYNVVDMKLNGGNGKVVQKNKVLLKNVELSKVVMQACKHANGKDWWLLKHALDTNLIYKFIVTEDSIYGPYMQSFAEPKWDYIDLSGQSAFSKDGKKYAVTIGIHSKLFVADFDRCSGELTNPKIYNLPEDSTGYLSIDSMGIKDVVSNGVCFSNNNQFLYISKRYNIYQLELTQPDSNLAWYRVKHGGDTSKIQFEYYGQLYRAPNNKIYIGKVGGSFKQFSVIDFPDNKGAACGFCRKCFRIDTADGGITSPPNMPDYELGVDLSKPCNPVFINNISASKMQMLITPNPAVNSLNIYLGEPIELIEIFSLSGAIVLQQKCQRQKQIEIAISKLTKGMYFIRLNKIHTEKLVID